MTPLTLFDKVWNAHVVDVLGPGIAHMMYWSREESVRTGGSLVIGNLGEHFSAGFNIQLILMIVYDGVWD
jgi:hypothetical protein